MPRHLQLWQRKPLAPHQLPINMKKHNVYTVSWHVVPHGVLHPFTIGPHLYNEGTTGPRTRPSLFPAHGIPVLKRENFACALDPICLCKSVTRLAPRCPTITPGLWSHLCLQQLSLHHPCLGYDYGARFEIARVTGIHGSQRSFINFNSKRACIGQQNYRLLVAQTDGSKTATALRFLREG